MLTGDQQPKASKMFALKLSGRFANDHPEAKKQ
jgi:hypothetical protein